MSTRRSAAPTSAPRPASSSPPAPSARCSNTTCGTSPPSPAGRFEQAAIRRLDFTPITDPRWRLVAKELIFALLVPRHDIVILLPRALRTALHLESCRSRFREISRLLHWLTDRGIPSLQDVNAEHCQQYLSHRSHTYADDGEVRGDLSSSTRRMAVQVILDLINYRDLFTADRVRGDLLPWGTQSSSAIADAQAGWRQNKTPPVDQEVLQPMLSAALYLAGTWARTSPR